VGYQFGPRLADIGETTFWCIDRTAGYGLLNNLARHRLNTDLIANKWDDLLRVAGSLKLGALSASDFMRTIHSGRRTSTLVHAITSGTPATSSARWRESSTWGSRFAPKTSSGSGRSAFST